MRETVVAKKLFIAYRRTVALVISTLVTAMVVAQQPVDAPRLERLDPALKSRPTREVPKWQGIPLDRLKVWRDAVQQLQEYGLEPDLSRASIVNGEAAAQWEYVVPVRLVVRRAPAEGRAGVPPADGTFRPARVIAIADDDALEGLAPPIVAFEGGNLALPNEPPTSTSPKGGGAAPSLLGSWTSWRWHSTTCSTRVWCSKDSKCGDRRCATYDVEYRNKIDNKGRVTKTDWRYKFKYCGC